MGPLAGNRVQDMGLTYVSRRGRDGWTLDSGDMLAGSEAMTSVGHYRLGWASTN